MEGIAEYNIQASYRHHSILFTGIVVHGFITFQCTFNETQLSLSLNENFEKSFSMMLGAVGKREYDENERTGVDDARRLPCRHKSIPTPRATVEMYFTFCVFSNQYPRYLHHSTPKGVKIKL